MMGVPKAELLPSAVFLVRATGGGKSLVRDTVAAATLGVTLSISPLLSLGADQESNLNHGLRDNCGAIAAYHLDEFSHDKKKQQAIVKEILSNEISRNKAIILFASPQAIAENKTWRETIDRTIERRTLRLVCVDEVHLFCSFGFGFRSEVYSLKGCLFSKLVAPNSPSIAEGTVTVCPILAMTATATKDTVEQFSLLTGIKVDTSSNVFWPTGPNMCRRELNLVVEYTTNQMAQFKKQSCELLSVNDPSKIILYTNSQAASEKYNESIINWLNEKGYHGDAVLINGSFTKDEKFHRARLFAKTDDTQTMLLPSQQQETASSEAPAPAAGTSDSASLPANPYNNQSRDSPVPRGIGPDDSAFDRYHPRVLTATIDAIAAGLDIYTVREVYQAEFQCSVANLLQAAGRVGRYPGALPVDNRYTNYISFEGYMYLFRRLFLPSGESDGGMPKDLAKLIPPDK